MSERSIALIQELRREGVLFVYVTGARKSTLLERLPIMGAVDAAFAETGGRFVRDGCTVLDGAWTGVHTPACGPASAHDLAPARQNLNFVFHVLALNCADSQGNKKAG